MQTCIECYTLLGNPRCIC